MGKGKSNESRLNPTKGTGIEDHKTNIYYPKIPCTFFLVSKEKAEAEAELIKTGQIFPHDGNYENFDTCGTYYANLMDAKEIVRLLHG